jgi:hypothetical protein
MEDDDVEDDPSHMRLLAEPPREDGFEAFYSERPAFVLARVDGDELAHLLDSRAGTPLDTPRVDGDEDKPGARRAHSAGSKRSGGSRKEQEVRKPARWGADIEDDILEPGPVTSPSKSLSQTSWALGPALPGRSSEPTAVNARARGRLVVGPELRCTRLRSLRSWTKLGRDPHRWSPRSGNDRQATRAMPRQKRHPRRLLSCQNVIQRLLATGRFLQLSVSNMREFMRDIEPTRGADDSGWLAWQFFGNDPGTEKQKLWTIAQARLLCIISLYAATGVYPEDEETWIKILHLHVLVFEGIQLRLFDMSLVPTPLTATTPAGISRQIFLQVAPQTTTFLNDLARMGLLNCLRIMTHGQWPTSAYQVSERGQEFVRPRQRHEPHEAPGVCCACRHSSSACMVSESVQRFIRAGCANAGAAQARDACSDAWLEDHARDSSGA